LTSAVYRPSSIWISRTFVAALRWRAFQFVPARSLLMAGLHLATLCKHQAKRATATVAEESESRGGTHAEAGTSALGLASLDLGGLVRLTGSGLSKCLRHATMLTSLDLSGCTGLSAPGFVDAIGALPVEQRRRLTRLTMTGFVTGQSEAGSMLAPTAARQQSGTWAASSTWERLQQLLGPQATITFE
jgi:hypothetical protein